jgi:hypothetical protein
MPLCARYEFYNICVKGKVVSVPKHKDMKKYRGVEVKLKAYWPRH